MKASLFNKLPCDVKCLIIDKVSKDNHKELMNELTTHKEIERCKLCSSAIKVFNYEVDDSENANHFECEDGSKWACACLYCYCEEENKYRTIPDYITPWD